jgi:hypothetical protein
VTASPATRLQYEKRQHKYFSIRIWTVDSLVESAREIRFFAQVILRG